MDTKETYQAVFEAAPDAMIVADQSGKIVLVNQQVKKLFGYESAELVGREVEMLIPERLTGRHQHHRAAYAGNPQAREMGPDRELIARRKDGSEFYVEISLSPIIAPGRSLVSAAIRDVTDRKSITNKLRDTLQVLESKNNELEQFAYAAIKDAHDKEIMTNKLQETMLSLESKNKELEQFAYVASHDLQEPLRSVINVMDLFKIQYQSQLGADAAMYISFMHESTERMTNLIKGLLDYSRIGQKTERESVDLNKLLAEVMADLSSAISESKAEIEIPWLPTLNVYQVEIRLLFQNLIANAIKFRRQNEAPVIKIIAKEQPDNSWHFAVHDNGIGIEQKYLDRIFIIFQRLHTRDEYEGTGIGLSYCRKITELHGGKIWVESEPGTGSIFHFSILN